MRNTGNASLLNHISAVSPGTLAAMQKLFGISLDDFLKAVYGDHQAIRKLADMGKLSEVAKLNLEPALAAAKLAIETTGDLNKAIADLVKQSATSGKQTTKAILDSRSAETKFQNELRELQQGYVQGAVAETARHLHASSLIEIRGATADLMALTRYQEQVRKEDNKIPLAEHSAELDYQKAISSALWSQGSEAQLDRITKPNYQANQGRMG
ncbi:MAG: phasin family protein, partial [Coleofasciculaceae cyanobacterium]